MRRTLTSAAPRRMGSALVTVMTMALAGCGEPAVGDLGRTAGVEGVVEVFEAWTGALADGDGARACGLMIVTAARDLTNELGAASCPAAVTALHGSLTVEERAVLASATIHRTAVDFDSDDAARIWHSDVRSTGGPFVLLPGRHKNVTVLCLCDDRWQVQYPAEFRQPSA
ncbi:hypothetical protein KZZ52_52490 [Dactylosporangium sp. AC04546]|uniref:hypothetical protein n=1 Tax=Dactylosporangium sp. AC04546 TaxID=2862460 RepID=UPI001EDFFD4E|nr:hypothetical protein [Dactylosporangium sp. AC04546]WVK82481.1 hypothetical protein KZZ52_52490 [Dactylosporangium sp. AC04546]